MTKNDTPPAQRPRLVHVITSLRQGGAETVLYQLVAGLRDDFDQTVIYFYDGPLRVQIEATGTKCIHITAWGSYANPLFFFRLAYRVSQQRPQCIHTVLWAANFLGLIVATWLGIPCVRSVHTVIEHEGKIRRWLDRLMPLCPTKVVAVSPTVARSLGHTKCHTNLLTIPNGIDYERVQELGQRVPPIPLSTTHTLIFGTVGRLVPVKNYPLLIDSFASLVPAYPNIHLVIIGSGEQEETLRKQIAERNLKAHVTIITGQQAYPYYRHFTCFVQPSAYEGLSLALLEAMSCALPVMVSAQHDNKHDVITDGVTGLVIQPNDQQALTNALRQVITNPARAQQWGIVAQELVKKEYTSSIMVKRYKELFLSVYLQELD